MSQPTLEQFIDSRASPDSYVLVVHNGPFEAAFPIEDELDYLDFTHPSETRPLTWLKISKENLCKL